jgi:type I restriction enzyme S subunit
VSDNFGIIADLPESWVWTTLGEICLSSQYGWTTSASKQGDLHLLRTTDITQGNINWSLVPFCQNNPPDVEKYLLYDGDILISRAGSVGYSYLIRNPEKAVFASYLIRFRPLIEGRYLSFFLKSPNYWKSISEKSIGIALANVNASKLRQIVVPLPPLPEQSRIADKVEELFSFLDAGTASLRKVQAQLKRYRQAVLKYAFEGKLTEEWRKTHQDQIEPTWKLLSRIGNNKDASKSKKMPLLVTDNLPKLPDTWTWVRLGDVADLIQYGTSEKTNLNNNGIPVLRMGNIQDGKLNFKNLKYLPKNTQGLHAYFLEAGDVLFNRTNSAELVGKTAVYQKNHPASAFASYLIRVKLIKESCDPDILCYYINSYFGRNYINSVVSQQVGQANVNGTKLSMMPIPLISRKEQETLRNEIERLISIISETETVVLQELKQAEFLRQGLLREAFAGRIVPQDSADEPAEKLLNRIKSSRISNKEYKIDNQLELSNYVK